MAARANADTERRLRAAGFPYAASIEQFDFRFRPELKRQVVLRYLDPSFVAQARSLTLIGAPGLGKTMLAICVATKQVQLGATARFITAQGLAGQLGRPATAGAPAPAQAAAGLRRAGAGRTGLPADDRRLRPGAVRDDRRAVQQRPTILTSNKSLTDWARSSRTSRWPRPSWTASSTTARSSI